jgi:excinuclease ABC subunit C
MDLQFELPVDALAQPDLDEVPAAQGVFLLQFDGGTPYLGLSRNLKWRLKRWLGSSSEGSRWAGLRESIRRVSYQPTGSAFEAKLLLYRLARKFRPETYRKYLKLRPPPFVKVQLANAYPRTYITTRLTRRRALFFGPFPTRAAAERFEGSFLDLFLIRRCQEEIVPDPAHPGCIYGEMDMCLRPCQARSSEQEYHAEVGRVLKFLNTRGQSLVREIEQARDDASAALEFEQASSHHRKLEKAQEALKLADGLARDIDSLFGLVIQPSAAEQAVELFWVYQGFLQPAMTFHYSVVGGRSVSLDSRLRDLFQEAEHKSGTPQERTDHLALLNRWYRSSWRKGEVLLFDGIDQVPYRKLVRAISRVAKGQQE